MKLLHKKGNVFISKSFVFSKLSLEASANKHCSRDNHWQTLEQKKKRGSIS
jgi:hypothetical protein